MAVVPQCDRCKLTNIQVVTVLGVDLCRDCIESFREWAKGRFRTGKNGRAGYRERLSQAHMVIARDGYVTSYTLSEVTGLTKTQANAYLHNSAHGGRLKYVRSGRFVRAEELDGEKLVKFSANQAQDSHRKVVGVGP